MPFINDKLDETARKRALSGEGSAPIASRFRFDPVEVMALLHRRIVGQQRMKADLEATLYLVKADLGSPHRPRGVLFFLGPTGVGKTETVRVVAQAIHGDSDHFCRIDMNTLAQQHYSAAISGAPPGYVGSKEEHTLFNPELIQGSYSKPGIVLFDEIEKADRDVVRTLLNILDTGKLRLAGGAGEIDFRNSLVFMTSNIGAREVADARLARSQRRFFRALSVTSRESLIDRALHRHFDPEFLNRLDRITLFDEIETDQLDALIDIELARLQERLSTRGVSLRLSPELREQIKEGYNKNFGARGMARCFQHWVVLPLSRLLVEEGRSGELVAVIDGGEVRIIASD